MFLGIILRVLRLEVSVYNVYVQTSFKPVLFNPLVEVTVNSKGENSFFPKYVQEFCLWMILYSKELDIVARLG
jgi:hypothetical protein